MIPDLTKESGNNVVLCLIQIFILEGMRVEALRVFLFWVALLCFRIVLLMDKILHYPS